MTANLHEQHEVLAATGVHTDLATLIARLDAIAVEPQTARTGGEGCGAPQPRSGSQTEAAVHAPAAASPTAGRYDTIPPPRQSYLPTPTGGWVAVPTTAPAPNPRTTAGRAVEAPAQVGVHPVEVTPRVRDGASRSGAALPAALLKIGGLILAGIILAAAFGVGALLGVLGLLYLH